MARAALGLAAGSRQANSVFEVSSLAFYIEALLSIKQTLFCVYNMNQVRRERKIWRQCERQGEGKGAVLIL